MNAGLVESRRRPHRSRSPLLLFRRETSSSSHSDVINLYQLFLHFELKRKTFFFFREGHVTGADSFFDREKKNFLFGASHPERAGKGTKKEKRASWLLGVSFQIWVSPSFFLPLFFLRQCECLIPAILPILLHCLSFFRSLLLCFCRSYVYLLCAACVRIPLGRKPQHKRKTFLFFFLSLFFSF